MRFYKKCWIIGVLITVVFAVFLFCIIRSLGTSGTSSKTVRGVKTIQAKTGQLSSLHAHTKNPSEMSIDSDTKEKQISDSRSRHSAIEKEQDGTSKDLDEEEMAALLDEYLSQYEGNEDITSPEELEKSVNPNEDIPWHMGPDGVRHYMRPGEVVVYEGWGVGTWNPRPRTKEEQRRFGEICQEIDDLRAQRLVQDPERNARIRARIAELLAELDEIKAETSLPSYHRIEIGVYRRDPETGKRIIE